MTSSMTRYPSEASRKTRREHDTPDEDCCEVAGGGSARAGQRRSEAGGACVARHELAFGSGETVVEDRQGVMRPPLGEEGLADGEARVDGGGMIGQAERDEFAECLFRQRECLGRAA